MLGSLTIAMRAASAFSITSVRTKNHPIRRPALQGRLPRAMQQQSIYTTKRSFTGILMSTDDDGDTDDATTAKSVESTWNLGGLKKEVSRLTVRCHKKIGKANQRLEKANKEVDRLTGDPDVSLEELEKCPNVEEMQSDLENLRERLTQLNQLEVSIAEVKGKKVVLPEHVAQLAIDLEVRDEAPARQARPSKKEKGPRNMKSFRLPYRRFYTDNKTEIRVGKQAEDNDELSCSPEHRSGADWWMHASGCPGSHVVIRCTEQNVDEEVVKDAAALAARQSKCSGNTIKVSMTRARDVKKPPGAKAGLVQLTGSVRTIAVNMKEAEVRLNRLDKTCLIN
ncbi:MAG: hypothetical protein SGBAC_011613 [Bacillariaceae sp.]